jgi:hypothetical protein
MNEITLFIPNEALIKGIEQAISIEQPELSVSDRLSLSKGDYFVNKVALAWEAKSEIA